MSEFKKQVQLHTAVLLIFLGAVSGAFCGFLIFGRWNPVQAVFGAIVVSILLRLRSPNGGLAEAADKPERYFGTTSKPLALATLYGFGLAGLA